MVLFMDLSSTSTPTTSLSNNSISDPTSDQFSGAPFLEAFSTPHLTKLDNLTLTTPTSSIFSIFLNPYPILASLTRHLDHNDLYNLSCTNKQVYINMRPYRKGLLNISLRCQGNNGTSKLGASTHDPKVRCPGDLVNPCIRCRRAVCRNCRARLSPTLLKTWKERAVKYGRAAIDVDYWLCWGCTAGFTQEKEIEHAMELKTTY